MSSKMGMKTRMRMGLRACIWSGWICSSPNWPFMRNACNVHREPCMCRDGGESERARWLGICKTLFGAQSMQCTTCNTLKAIYVHAFHTGMCINNMWSIQLLIAMICKRQLCEGKYIVYQARPSFTLHFSGSREMVRVDRQEGRPLSKCSSHLPILII